MTNIDEINNDFLCDNHKYAIILLDEMINKTDVIIIYHDSDIDELDKLDN